VIEVKGLIADMWHVVRGNNEDGRMGCGLAANQVGSTKRVLVINTRHTQFTAVNPVITKMSSQQVVSEEGCLSFPEGLLVKIHRAKQISVNFLDAKGKLKKMKLRGLESRAFQHEMDHLDGITIKDRHGL
jgi:peptide deformylase